MNRILVIDDMQSNVELMAAHLSGAGYDTVTANDGATGIRKAKIFKPDLIVLDLIMPKMSGFDVCKLLKKDEDTKNTMILVVTSMHSKDSRIRAFEVGADEYMEKTFDKEVFLAKIKALLRVKSLNDKLKENYSVLEAQSKQLETQLEMARHIQQALIVEMNFTLNDVSFASCYKPAHRVGGDFYDIVTFGSDTLALFIADVSGHGISAALLTTMLKMMFRNTVEAHKETSQVLYQMNEEFCEIFEGSSVTIYACAFFAIFDMRSKVVRYSSAGGTQPMFFDSSEKTVSELQLSGKPLGMMNGSVYATGEIKYDRGDLFFFQTDGLCDSLYKEEPELFVKKLSELLIDSCESHPEEIIEEALQQFYNQDKNSENDDVSVIVCKME